MMKHQSKDIRVKKLMFLLTFFLSCTMVKAQEENKQGNSISSLIQLPKRNYYFAKEDSDSVAHIILEDTLQDSLSKPPILLRYYLSEDYKAPQRSRLLSSSLYLPLTFQSIKYDEYTWAKKLLEIDSCFSLSLGNKVSALSFEPSYMIDWAYNKALYLTTMKSLQLNHLEIFDASIPNLAILEKSLELASLQEKLLNLAKQEVSKGEMDNILQTLQLQQFEKRNWLTSFESSIQMSQNYLSENWYKGGQSNLNLHTRHYFALQYRSTDGRIVWNNEIEDKLGLYSSESKDSKRNYKISDDLLRLRTNFGLKAKGKWYYSFDTELRTQLFNTYKNQANKEILQSAFLSPFNLNLGLGMKYSYSKRGHSYGSKFRFTTNIAPLSFTYKKSLRQDIELGRYGLSTKELSNYSLGSTLKAEISWQFNMDISWTSRLYFNTSYSHVESEWENTLNMKIGRYFSTRINLNLRYDDSVPPLKNWQRYLQVNELLSFGFNYKL